jgi:hypothetical protein
MIVQQYTEFFNCIFTFFDITIIKFLYSYCKLVIKTKIVIVFLFDIILGSTLENKRFCICVILSEI